MSGYLWKAYLEDDIASFRAVLESASNAPRSSVAQKSHGRGHNTQLNSASFDGGNLEPLSSPPSNNERPHLSSGMTGIVLTRSDLNRRDAQGRTLLHLAASSKSDLAIEFAQALLEHPQTDIYLQDSESGWTALHRAFYEGNMSIAIAILTRDMQDAYGATTVNLSHPGGLIRIKDHEGNGPFDVLEQTYEDEVLRDSRLSQMYQGESDSDESDEDNGRSHYVLPTIKNASMVQGQEVFSFGSNKNLNLGFGDEDDRTYPERVLIRRPLHLIQEFWEANSGGEQSFSSSQIPFNVRCKPILIRDVQIGKYTSAVLTSDKSSNLHMCGHGSNGRLGLGDERTRFQFTCVDEGPLAKQEIVSVALGNHHTLALASSGAVFSWGSNMFGQLGYALPRGSKNDEPTQLLPRQIFGNIKREFICGIAASGSHSVLHTRTDLFTFGKNEGQLGIVDAEARSLDMINAPRKVGGNKFNSTIDSVSAIDHATICLLSNREVWVYANYGYLKMTFPMTFLPNQYFRTSFTLQGAQNPSSEQRVIRIASGGDTIAALTNTGTIFTVAVSRPTVTAQDASSSTTNPAKIRSALSQPVAVWANRKSRLAARDVAVDQNGSIILSTQAGSVWRRVRRAKIKDASAHGVGVNKPKDFKFSRISGLTSVTAVRASGFGAYAAVRKEVRVADQETGYPAKTLRRDLLVISPFADDNVKSEKQLITRLAAELPQHKDLDSILTEMFASSQADTRHTYDAVLGTASSEVKIPIHQFLLAACSPVLCADLNSADDSCSSELYTIHRHDGSVEIIFTDLDFLSLVNLALYIHSGHVMHAGRLSSKSYQQWNKSGKPALLQVAAQLQISGIIDTIRTGSIKQGSYRNALEHFFKQKAVDPMLLPGCNARVLLEDDQRTVHSALLCQRSEFFQALFSGGSGGRWLDGRNDADDLVEVDLSHISGWAFDIFLKWAYTDEDAALFKDLVADDLEEYLDKVVEVLGLANELMVEPLSEICQEALAQQVTARNVCQILVAVAPVFVTNLKSACLNYIFLNLEAVLRHGHLEELDEDLLMELDEVARATQQDRSIISRTGRLEEDLLRRHPGLEDRIAMERQAKIDSIMILNKYSDSLVRGSSSYKAGSFHELPGSPVVSSKQRRRSSNHEVSKPLQAGTKATEERSSAAELMFDMDADDSHAKLSTTPSMAENKTRVLEEAPEGWTTVPTTRDNSKIRMPSYGDRTTQARTESDTPQFSPSSVETPKRQSKPTPDSPWTGKETLTTSKLSMRDIIDQASSSRTSNLTIGLSVGQDRRSSGSSVATGKLSQKERKKLQHQAMQNVSTSATSPSPMTAQSSPWKSIPKAKSPGVSCLPSPQSNTLSGPHLTMRQTIANPVGGKNKALETPPSGSVAESSSKPLRIPSSDITPSKAAPSRSFSASRASPAPALQPHSIRHTPKPVRNLELPENMSMAHIQNQQHFDKLVALGGGEKRSLQEIQTEQEFEEWWQSESLRVQNEEAQASASKHDGKGVHRGARRREKKPSTKSLPKQEEGARPVAVRKPKPRHKVKPREADASKATG